MPNSKTVTRQANDGVHRQPHPVFPYTHLGTLTRIAPGIHQRIIMKHDDNGGAHRYGLSN
jgi:hypothetical protein